MSTTIKKGYAKRNSQPAVPISDSDPEFRAGAYVPTPARKRKGNPSADKSTAKRRKTTTIGKYTSSTLRKTGGNPLSKYFGGLDLHSASEDEDDEDPFDSFANMDTTSDEREKKPLPSRAASASKSASPACTNLAPDNDSDKTEDDTEAEIIEAPKKPLTKPATAESDDATESDTDSGAMSMPPRPIPIISFYAKDPESDCEPSDDDATESESEPEYVNQKLAGWRPGFPLTKDQKLAKPLILDEAQGIAIPTPINTYLREYQQDGVKFLWQRYNEGRGGLLGDDMGLGQ